MLYAVFSLTSYQDLTFIILNQPFIYFKQLTIWNIAGLIGYLFVSFYLCFYVNVQDQDWLLFFYTWMTGFGLYGLGYRALRNMTFYLCWVAIAFAQLYVYFQIHNNPVFKPNALHTINTANGLRNTIFLLIFYQVLRFISLKVQGKELVSLSRTSKTDLYDERNITNIDKVCFFIYIGAFACLIFLWK